jgi:hypothetical protein
MLDMVICLYYYGALNCMSSIDLDIMFLSLSDIPKY